MPINPTIKIIALGCDNYAIAVTGKNRTKYFPCSYQSNEIAFHVIDKLNERWYDCPVQLFIDYTETLVNSFEEILLCDYTEHDLQGSWISTERQKVDLNEVSGALYVRKLGSM